MGLLSEIFNIDEDTEKDIKDIVKAVGLIALILGGTGAAAGTFELPFNDKENEED